MANNIARFKAYAPMLDEVYAQASLTAILDGDPALASFGNAANELVIPKLSMSGLADYDRLTGYANGDVTLTNETVKCNYDRGRMFQIDTLDNLETASIAYGRLSGEFIRTKVVPELDAFRLATYASKAGIGSATGTLADGPAVIQALRAAHAAMDDAGVPAEGRVLYITSLLKGYVDDMDTTASRVAMEQADSVVVVPQNRFYTAITLGQDGYSRRAASGSGESAVAAGKDINFMLIHPGALIQFQKHVAPKVITPEQNPDADAWKFGYRTVGIADVYENKLAGIYCHAKA